jgi:hypothetical protein
VGIARSWYSNGITANALGLSTSRTNGATYLASLMAPPPAPTSQTIESVVFALFCIIDLVIAIATLIVQEDHTYAVEYTGNLLTIFVVFVVITVALIPKLRAALKRDEELQAIQHAKWSKVIARWNELLYCSRCNKVYHSQSRKWVDAPQLRSLLISDMNKGETSI